MKKNIIVSFTIIVASLIFLQVGVLPHYGQYKHLYSQLKTSQQALKNQKEYYSQLFTLKQRLDSYQLSLAKISSALPTDSDAPALYQLIQAKASENGLVIRGLGSLSINQKAAGNLGTITFGGVVEGGYEGLTSFLKAIEKSSRLIDIQTVSLQFEESGDNQVNNISQPLVPQYVLNFEAHYLKGI